MHFLVDEDLPHSTDDLLRRYEHEAVDVRDIGLRGAKDPQIAAYAQSKDLCLVTGDFDFSDIRNYPPREYAGLVVLKLPRTATAPFILNPMDLHLPRSEELDSPVARFQGQGDSRMARTQSQGFRYEPREERVYVNKTQYFEPVPLELWEYQIGGYQVLAKWLKIVGTGGSPWRRSKPTAGS